MLVTVTTSSYSSFITFFYYNLYISGKLAPAVVSLFEASSDSNDIESNFFFNVSNFSSEVLTHTICRRYPLLSPLRTQASLSDMFLLTLTKNQIKPDF